MQQKTEGWSKKATLLKSSREIEELAKRGTSPEHQIIISTKKQCIRNSLEAEQKNRATAGNATDQVFHRRREEQGNRRTMGQRNKSTEGHRTKRKRKI